VKGGKEDGCCPNAKKTTSTNYGFVTENKGIQLLGT